MLGSECKLFFFFLGEEGFNLKIPHLFVLIFAEARIDRTSLMNNLLFLLVVFILVAIFLLIWRFEGDAWDLDVGTNLNTVKLSSKNTHLLNCPLW